MNWVLLSFAKIARLVPPAGTTSHFVLFVCFFFGNRFVNWIKWIATIHSDYDGWKNKTITASKLSRDLNLISNARLERDSYFVDDSRLFRRTFRGGRILPLKPSIRETRRGRQHLQVPSGRFLGAVHHFGGTEFELGVHRHAPMASLRVSIGSSSTGRLQ